MTLTKPVEEYTLRELLLAIKDDGLFRAQRLAINHITEARGQPFRGHNSPIDLSNRRLGDAAMGEIMAHVPIRLLSTIKFVGDMTIVILIEFVQEHDIKWPIEIVTE